jgi:titin
VNFRSPIRVALPPCAVLFALELVGAFALRGAVFTVTNVADSGPGTLRSAITNANATPGPDWIHFNLTGTGPFTIAPLSPLPALTDPTIIDATTQPGYAGVPRVRLNGTAAGAAASGLRLESGASGSTIRGLAILAFGRYGVEVVGGSSNVIEACYLGVDVDGVTAVGNSGGVFLKGATDCIVGGEAPGAGNVISGNLNDGVYLEDNGGHQVLGNFIGLSAGGTARVPNFKQGVRIRFSANNQVGGVTPGARNVISANGESGVGIDEGGSSNNVVQGNFIGLNAAGTAALGNTNHGVFLTLRARANLIGGTVPGAGNVIAGNRLSGVGLSFGARDNVVQGNLIGTLPGGLVAAGNLLDGVSLAAATNNLIGGDTPGARNVIAGNGRDGVGLSGDTCRSNQVAGNFIGVNAPGTARLGNALTGVWLSNAVWNVVGGTNPGAGNVISGNGSHGVYLFGAGCLSNAVYGNLIGTDVTGTVGLGNGGEYYGVTLERGSANWIGGPLAAMRNVISSNQVGIYIGGLGPSNNVIQGNYIGTDITGLAPISNRKDGINLGRSNLLGQIVWHTRVGGAAPGEGNVVCANGYQLAGGFTNSFAGLFVGSAVGTMIQGNRFGVGADGVTPMGNFGHAVELLQATNTIVGGTHPAMWNIIANTYDGLRSGVRVRSGVGNVVLGNAIYSNGFLGLSLSGTAATPNDPCDGDTGPNGLQNYPVVTNAVTGANGTIVRGRLDSVPNQTYRLQFYANPAPDNSGFGEGLLYLGTATFTAGANCTNHFNLHLPATAPAGWRIAATATDPADNTSEFSPSLPVITVPPLAISPPTNGAFTVSWQFNSAAEAAAGAWQLLSTTNLAPPVLWQPVTEPPTVLNSGTLYRVTQAATNAARFYRLQFQ